MKTILVLTDFTPSAMNAADAAVFLSTKLRVNILLVNIFTNAPAMPSGQSSSWSVQSFNLYHQLSKEKLQKETERLESHIIHTTSQLHKPNIDSVSAFGNIPACVKNIIHDHDIGLIVMGCKLKTVSGFIFGNNIYDIINKIKLPILVIPQQRKLNHINAVSLASDLSTANIKTLKWLNQIANLFGFNIHVTHVSKPVPVTSYSEQANIAHFEEELAQLNYKNVVFHTLHGDEVTTELLKFSQQINVDLMALIYKQHSFTWHLLNDSICDALMTHQSLPLLIFPDPEVN